MSRLLNIDCFFKKFKKYIEKHFDYILIDEVQDFAAHDFDLLINLAALDIKITAVGDFYQHTYESSVDGNKNINLYKDYTNYKKRFYNKYDYDEETLTKTYRCSKNVSRYINDNLGIKISSHRNDDTDIKYIEKDDEIKKIIHDSNIIKLFFQEHYKYNINKTNNWGNSKGSTYDNVCVVLNKTTFKHFKNNDMIKINERSMNKLYVAITRTKGNLYFIEEKKLSEYKKY